MGNKNPAWKGGKKTPEDLAMYTRNWRKGNEDYVRDYYYRKKFGITKADYDYMLVNHDDPCAIYQTIPKRRRLCVDHCHSTGKVRGLLCDTCNNALGLFSDDPQLLAAALEYVKGESRAGSQQSAV